MNLPKTTAIVLAIVILPCLLGTTAPTVDSAAAPIYFPDGLMPIPDQMPNLDFGAIESIQKDVAELREAGFVDSKQFGTVEQRLDDFDKRLKAIEARCNCNTTASTRSTSKPAKVVCRNGVCYPVESSSTVVDSAPRTTTTTTYRVTTPTTCRVVSPATSRPRLFGRLRCR